VAAEPVSGARVLKLEKTCWVASKHHRVHLQDPLPIALFDRACWWRDIALAALDSTARKYREVFSSESVSGISAAVAAGVAVALVLQLREGVDSRLAQAMCDLIEASFGASHA
jgi:DNA-binding transcriptional LysR family regulator